MSRWYIINDDENYDIDYLERSALKDKVSNFVPKYIDKVKTASGKIRYIYDEAGGGFKGVRAVGVRGSKKIGRKLSNAYRTGKDTVFTKLDNIKNSVEKKVGKGITSFRNKYDKDYIANQESIKKAKRAQSDLEYAQAKSHAEKIKKAKEQEAFNRKYRRTMNEARRIMAKKEKDAKLALKTMNEAERAYRNSSSVRAVVAPTERYNSKMKQRNKEMAQKQQMAIDAVRIAEEKKDDRYRNSPKVKKVLEQAARNAERNANYIAARKAASRNERNRAAIQSAAEQSSLRKYKNDATRRERRLGF